MKLLKEAGFDIKDKMLVDAAGKPVTVEILVQDPAAERIALFYKPSLERIGVTTSIRIVDDAQYENRLRSFDFDMIINTWGQSLSPGNEQREFWGSQAADQPGSRNTVGIKNPAVDKLIDEVIFAKDRAGSCRGDQSARSRAAVEFLRGAAVHLSFRALRALGSFQPCRASAEICEVRPAVALVV